MWWGSSASLNGVSLPACVVVRFLLCGTQCSSCGYLIWQPGIARLWMWCLLNVLAVVVVVCLPRMHVCGCDLAFDGCCVEYVLWTHRNSPEHSCMPMVQDGACQLAVYLVGFSLDFVNACHWFLSPELGVVSILQFDEGVQPSTASALWHLARG